jgi:phage shock protein C
MGTRLYRSRDDRMLAGVAGGLAEMWDADPSLVRIVWALLVVLTGGIALVVYIVMAIVVPEEPYDAVIPGGPPMNPGAAAASTDPAGAPGSASSPMGGTPSATYTPPPDWRSMRSAARDQRRAARAARRAEHGYDGRTGSIVIGAILVLVGLGFLIREYIPAIDFDYVWPLVLVALGAVVLLSAFRGSDRGSGGGPS